jgi:AraC family transcriptional regulator
MNGIYREIASNDEFSGIAIEGLVLTLLAATLRDPISPMRAPSWLIDVRHELLQKLTKTVCLRNLAKGAGVAPSHLAAVFHKHFGMTVGEFVRRTRAERAQDLLENGSLPLGEIAILLGYSDQSHFTRSFKALRGVTPSEWRRLKGRR